MTKKDKVFRIIFVGLVLVTVALLIAVSIEYNNMVKDADSGVDYLAPMLFAAGTTFLVFSFFIIAWSLLYNIKYFLSRVKFKALTILNVIMTAVTGIIFISGVNEYLVPTGVYHIDIYAINKVTSVFTIISLSCFALLLILRCVYVIVKGIIMEKNRKIVRVVAAVIRDGNRIFATQRGSGNMKGGWEFPGGKIEENETPKQALVREIKEELDTEIEVGDLIETVEYDYEDFHLSMDCFWCKVVNGNLVLKEAEDSKWLTKDIINSVDWLPADLELVCKIKRQI